MANDGSPRKPSGRRPSLSHFQPLQSPTQKPAAKSLTTPHDSLLAELVEPPRPGGNESAAGKEDFGLHADVDSFQTRDDQLRSRSDLNLLTPTPSVRATKATAVETLHDPFDGSLLGMLSPLSSDDASRHYDQSYSQVNLTDGVESTGAQQATLSSGDAVWSHLSRILALQTQISKMHLDMEGIGSMKPPEIAKHRPPASSNPFANSDSTIPQTPGPRRKRTLSAGSISDDGEGDDEVQGATDESERNRIREEEFAKLASQFEGRKGAIQNIMGKASNDHKLWSSTNLNFDPSSMTSPRL